MAEKIEEETNLQIKEIMKYISPEAANSSNSKNDIKILKRLRKIKVSLTKIEEISNEMKSLSTDQFEDIKDIVESSAKLAEVIKKKEFMRKISNESIKFSKDSIQVLEFLIQPNSLYLMKIKNTLSIDFESLSIYFTLGPLKLPLLTIKHLKIALLLSSSSINYHIKGNDPLSLFESIMDNMRKMEKVRIM